jgi:hypothetical protein
MSEFHRRGQESEGRSGSPIDLEEGGRYLGIPQNPSHTAHEPVTINPVSTKSEPEYSYAAVTPNGLRAPVFRGLYRHTERRL